MLTHAQADIFISPRPYEELFDVKKDPLQLLNLASMPQYQDILMDMRKLLLNWQNNTGDTTPKNLTPDWFDRETGEPLDIIRKRGKMPGNR